MAISVGAGRLERVRSCRFDGQPPPSYHLFLDPFSDLPLRLGGSRNLGFRVSPAARPPPNRCYEPFQGVRKNPWLAVSTSFKGRPRPNAAHRHRTSVCRLNRGRCLRLPVSTSFEGRPRPNPAHRHRTSVCRLNRGRCLRLSGHGSHADLPRWATMEMPFPKKEHYSLWRLIIIIIIRRRSDSKSGIVVVIVIAVYTICCKLYSTASGIFFLLLVRSFRRV